MDSTGRHRGRPWWRVTGAIACAGGLSLVAPTVARGGEIRFPAQDHGFLNQDPPSLFIAGSGRVWSASLAVRTVSFDGISWSPFQGGYMEIFEDGAGGIWGVNTGFPGTSGAHSQLIQLDAPSGRRSFLVGLPAFEYTRFGESVAYSAIDTALLGFKSDLHLIDLPWQRERFTVSRGLIDPLTPRGRIETPGWPGVGALIRRSSGDLLLRAGSGAWYRRRRSPATGGAEWEPLHWPYSSQPPWSPGAPGTYWAADDTSLVAWSPETGEIARHRYGRDLTIGRVRDLFEDASGHLWAQGLRGFAVRNRSGWLSLPPSSDSTLTTVFSAGIDSSGNLWSYQERPYEQAVDHSLTLVRFDGSYVHRPAGIAPPTFETNAGPLFAARGDSIAVIRGGSVELFPGAEGLSDPLDEDDQGFVWFRTSAGLLRFTPATGPQAIAGPPDTSFGHAAFLPTRRTQERWFRTDTRLFRHRAGTWTGFAHPERSRFLAAHPTLGVYGVFPDSGLQRFDFAREAWERLAPLPDKLAGLDPEKFDDVVSRIHVDARGDFWLVESECCLRRFDGSAWSLAAEIQMTEPRIFEDRQGGTYVRGVNYDPTSPTLFELAGAQWRPIYLRAPSGDAFGPQPFLEQGPYFDSMERPWLFGFLAGFGRIAALRHEGAWRLVPFELPAGAGTPVLLDADDQLWLTSGTVMRLDRTAPVTVILNPPPARLPTSEVSIACVPMLEAGTGMEYQQRVVDEAWGTTWSSTSTQTFSLPDGRHCVEIRARDRFGNVEPTPRLACFEIDTRPPLGSLVGTPALVPEGDSLAVVGSAADANFRSYDVRILPIACGRADSTRARSHGMRTQPVESDTLAMFGGFDSGEWPDGRYRIELTVVDDLGLTGLTSAEIVLDRSAPFDEETSPADRTREQGGVVHAEAGAAVLAIPPLALEADASVEVDVGALEDFGRTAPSSGSPLGDAIRLSFGATPMLVRPAVLSVRVGATCALPLGVPAPAGSEPALHRGESDGSWTRLGGTLRPDGAWLDVPVDRAGVFALFAGDTAPEGGQAALARTLELTPRVFRAASTPGAASLLVSFGMEAAGSVSAFVHDRAGRRVRTLADGSPFGPGIQSLRWDGRDAAGDAVTHGLYIVTVRTPAATLTRTCVVEAN